MIPRQEALLALGLLFLIGVVATIARLLRARKHGISIRLQVFVVLASTSFLLFGVFAAIVTERLHARAGQLSPQDVVDNGMLVREVLYDVAPKIALLALILAGAAAVAGIVIGRVLGAPIERLTLAAQRVASGERQAKLPVPRGREVKELTAAFESMRRELEERHAVESLATDLSHELKNPVASIRASAEVLEDAMASDPEAARKFLGRIVESSDKLAALTRDLLSLARLEAHDLDRTEEADLAEVARTAVASLEERARTREVGLEVIGDAELRVVGQARWLERAVENLVANALDAAQAGSTVTVSFRERRGRAEVLVEDRGPGIDPGVADRVFERFVTTRHGAGGTGLGLAIVRAVAESHGGSAELHSTGPDGTVFAFTIPTS